MGRRRLLARRRRRARAGAARRSPRRPQQLTFPASDGAQLACSLVEPDGAPPTGGWPASCSFTGSAARTRTWSRSRRSSSRRPATRRSSATRAATAPPGACSGSTGRATCRTRRSSSPGSRHARELATRRSARSASRSAAARSGTRPSAGVPFKAIVPVITWTNLATALAPQGLSKSGLVQLPRRARAREPLGPRAPRARSRRSSTSTNMATVDGARRDALADREARDDHDADAPDPGPARLPLRHRPGARRVQAAQGPEAALPRRPRPRARHLARDRARRGRSTGARPSSGSTATSRARQRHRQASVVELGHDPYDGKTTTYTALPRDEDDLGRRCPARRR